MNTLQKIKCILLDLDGTVYLDGKAIDGAVEAIKRIRHSGRRVFFVTNNSSVSKEDYFVKLQNMGIEPEQNEIISSSMATTAFINKNLSGKRVLLLGTDRLKEEFEKSGICLCDDNPEVCVLGFDKSIDYQKMVRFNYYLKKGAFYIATHDDLTCPYPEVYIPDAGSFIAMFQKSSGRMPDIVCGKPYRYIVDLVEQQAGICAQQMAMVGDRLTTDIAFAKAHKMTSILVLTGETTKQMLSQSNIIPDTILDSIKDIVKIL